LEATLKQFLSNPNAFASGTSMPPPNLSAEDVERLVAVLKTLSTAN
jgi:cytochrome c2